jgi:hypothetical protein
MNVVARCMWGHRDLTLFSRAGLCPRFCFAGQAVEQFLNACTFVFQSGSIKVRWQHQWRTDDSAGSRERSRHGETVPAVHSPRPVVAEAHHDEWQLQSRRQVDRALR